MKEEKFIVPSHWYVAVKDLKEFKVIMSWIDKNVTRVDSCHKNHVPDKYPYYVNCNPNSEKTHRLFSYHDCVTNDFGKQITFEEFQDYILLTSILKPIMKKETMTKTIKHNEAQQIIDIACPQWKTKLALNWAVDIVQKKSIVISDEFYKEMRNACTASQTEVFNKIFGQDRIPNGKWVTWSGYNKTVGKVVGHKGKHYQLDVNGNLESHSHCHEEHIRLATKEEIESAQPKDGTPCLVRDNNNNGWCLRYSDGNGRFYHNTKKSGERVSFMYWRILDINNLPIND